MFGYPDDGGTKIGVSVSGDGQNGQDGIQGLTGLTGLTGQDGQDGIYVTDARS